MSFDQSFRWLPLTERAGQLRGHLGAGDYFRSLGTPDVEEIRLIHAEALFTAEQNLPHNAAEVDAELTSLMHARLTLNAAATRYDAWAPATAPTSQASKLEVENAKAWRVRMNARRPAAAKLAQLRFVLNQLSQRAMLEAVQSGQFDSRQADLQDVRQLCDSIDSALVALVPANEDGKPASLPELDVGTWSTPQRDAAERMIDRALSQTSRRRPQTGDLPDFIRARIQMLTYEAFGSNNVQAIPMELFDLSLRPGKRDGPPVAGVTPISTVVSASRTGSNRLVITGNGFSPSNVLAASLRPTTRQSQPMPRQIAAGATITVLSPAAVAIDFDVSALAVPRQQYT